MRIVSFAEGGAIRFGVRSGDRVRIHPTATSPLDLAHATMAHAAGADLSLAELDLLPPVPRPGKIVCIGLNYREHAKEGGNPVPDYPAVFLRSVTSLVPHAAPMLRPPCSDKLDFEAELAVVIGTVATRVRADEALRHVAGYACFNDGSVRDYQRKDFQAFFCATMFSAPVFEIYGDIIARGAFMPANTTVPTGLKDLDLVLHAARGASVRMPFAEIVRNRLADALSQGLADHDWSVIARKPERGPTDDGGAHRRADQPGGASSLQRSTDLE